MADEKKVPIRQRKAIMIRPDPNLLEAMEATAAKEGISLNRLALEIIETSGRLGSEKAAGTRAELNDAVSNVEAAMRKLRAAMS
jgi:EAL domain-containing protein (putative c-di-GMP-specific phosphodiesterase class I)